MATEENKAIDEAEIAALIDGWAKAFRAKNTDGIMSVYAPELVAFDLVPPLRYVGADEYRKVWEETFEFFQGPIDLEMPDPDITTGDDLAFAHSLGRLAATMTNGQKAEYWFRWTTHLRKINGNWLITHEHVSLPADVESGKAVMDLKP